MKTVINVAWHTKHMRSPQRGFTLLELVLSMTLSALLLGMLSAGVYAVVSDWQNETSVLDTSLDKALVVLQLERALLAAFPHSYVDNERLARFVYFKGTSDELRFVSAISPQHQPGLTAWRLLSSADKGLQLTLTPAFSDNPDTRFELLEPLALLSNYKAEFRYLLQRNPDEKEWLEEWDGQVMQSLPLAVYIVLTPIDKQQDDPLLDLIAPIKTYRHEDIQPVLPVN